jgi:hypothetical protein
MSMRDSMMAALQLRMQQQQQQDQTALANAAQQPIPGLTGPTSSGQIPGQPPLVGMAPPQQPLPAPGQALQPFMANGPYGQQAMQLAGMRQNMFAPGQMPHGTQFTGNADPRLQQLGLTMEQAQQIPMLGAYGSGGLRDAFQQRFPGGGGGILGGMLGRSGNHMVQQPHGLLDGGKGSYRPGGK